jgi:hypothetical protein
MDLEPANGTHWLTTQACGQPPARSWALTELPPRWEIPFGRHYRRFVVACRNSKLEPLPKTVGTAVLITTTGGEPR